MATRAFSVEDGNLATKPITTSQTRTYKDIDLTFAKKATGEIFKKTDAAAVKQSIKNILMTNRTERPFNPDFGGNLNNFLFSLDTEFDEFEIEDAVITSLVKFEPRARVTKIHSVISPDYNSVSITIKFQVLSTSTNEQITLSLTRLR
jgi:phage baseplate assembly protein W